MTNVSLSLSPFLFFVFFGQVNLSNVNDERFMSSFMDIILYHLEEMLIQKLFRGYGIMNYLDRTSPSLGVKKCDGEFEDREFEKNSDSLISKLY